MKKRMYATLFAAALVLSGCGAEERQAAVSSASSGGDYAVAVVSAPAAEATAESAETMSTAKTEEANRLLTEEEILVAYDRAITAYEWFDLNPLPCGGPVVKEGGASYQRVQYAGFDTLDDLKTYLGSLFSQEVIDNLFPENTAAPRYRDIDGELYVRPGGREADPKKSSASAAVEQQADGSYRINVTVDLLDEDQLAVIGVECYAFPYQNINGRWVFTDFELVY